MDSQSSLSDRLNVITASRKASVEALPECLNKLMTEADKQYPEELAMVELFGIIAGSMLRQELLLERLVEDQASVLR